MLFRPDVLLGVIPDEAGARGKQPGPRVSAGGRRREAQVLGTYQWGKPVSAAKRRKVYSCTNCHASGV